MLHIAASSLVDQPPRCVLDVLRRGLRDERANEVVCRLFERLHRQRVAVHELLQTIHLHSVNLAAEVVSRNSSRLLEHF